MQNSKEKAMSGSMTVLVERLLKNGKHQIVEQHAGSGHVNRIVLTEPDDIYSWESFRDGYLAGYLKRK